MATKRIPKSERIGDVIRSLAARSRIYGTEREKAWALTLAADAGEYCAHVAEYQHQVARVCGNLAKDAQTALVNLTGALV